VIAFFEMDRRNVSVYLRTKLDLIDRRYRGRIFIVIDGVGFADLLDRNLNGCRLDLLLLRTAGSGYQEEE